eukprot:TRINITY_DN9097_c1_g1_i5.p1 TRINITY_DN9097_c1_g1~~TRINITY_DN9097_c1_g1_i5.p1  ORF type:complete len:113 (-),score=24.85 TRINITY_DN9097_c1_g1_i5:300-638(-)
MNQFYDNEVEESSIPHTIPISSQSNEGGCVGGMHPTDTIDNVLEFPTSDASALLLNMNQFQAQSHEVNLHHDQFPEEGPFYMYIWNLPSEQFLGYDMDDMQLDPGNINHDPG